MNRKKICRFFCILFLCMFALMPAFSVTINAQKVDPKKGFPYNDDKNFRYKVEAHPDIPSGWQGADYVLANKITIWDATLAVPKIISVDDYIVTFKNLPKPETPSDDNSVLVYLHNEETKPKEISTVSYSTSYRIQSMGTSSDPDENWKNLYGNDLAADQSNSIGKTWEGTFGKHRAKYYEYDTEPQINQNSNYRYSRMQNGGIAVQLEDIAYPKSVLYLVIDWNVSCSYYLGSSWVNDVGFVVNEEKLPEVKALNEAAIDKTKEFISQLSNISYVVQKAPELTKESANVIIKTEASKQEEEVDFSVPAAVVLGLTAVAAGLAGLAGAGAAGAAAGAVENKSSDDGDTASYQMIIGKDFGNALKYGKKQRVWARMTELSNGTPVNRPDLTAGISIFSKEVLVGAASLLGNNIEAVVEIQENAPPEGIISFLYSGEHGTFQNNMRFRLLGKGEIKLAFDEVNILSTDDKPFELEYKLINFTEEEPPLEITASSGLIALDMGKNDKQQPVVLISPGPDADPWDHKAFIKPCKCEITVMDGKLPIKVIFEVNVCYEGIGTSYTKLPINEIPADALIECFPDKEKQKREEKALWIPITVMKWDEKRRVLEPDIAKADSLAFTYSVHPDFEFKSPVSKTLAERVVKKAKLEAKDLPPPPSIDMDKMKKPSAYRLLTTADPEEGAAPFDIQITVSCGNTLEPLLIKAQLKPNPDFKGMVQWFLEYPIGSAAEEFIKLGNVATYHNAIDFIEGRIYPMSGVPWSSNLLWNKDDSSHYESGRWDIMRKSYIAIQDVKFPKGIGEDQFIQVQTLVHELCHVIEDQNGEYKVDAMSERHSYFLEHLSNLSRGLVGLENPSNNLSSEIQRAIHGAYQHYLDPHIMGDLSNIGPWFGGEFKLSAHELFDKYAYHIDTLGGKMSDTHREEVAKAFRHFYFPGNLSEVEYQISVKADSLGRFVETDGLFKDAVWTFRWNQGCLMAITLEQTEHIFEVGDYYWMGGNELKLNIKMLVRDKKDPSFTYDSVLVILDAGTYNMSARSFPYVRSFSTKWKSLNDHQHSLLFKKTGLNDFTSLTERKK